MSQAGLLSAVTSAFTIQVHPRLLPDPNEETAALLRVLIYMVNNATFDGDVPALPQWTGPPRFIVQVEAILYASLAASFFSAFLAMLGKQWLNRYASVNMRGSAIERSQNRQRKLNGIITWYFDHVMESLPLMLQFALLMLSCALSRYLYEIDTTVTLVVAGVTSFGLICYAFIVVAGTASVTCPYQTPGAQILRYLWRKVPNRSTLISKSTLATHVYAWFQTSFPTKRLPVQHPVPHPGPEQTPDREATALDFLCASWMLQMSLDRGIKELTLKFLGSLPGFEATIVMECLYILVSCVSVIDDRRVIVLRGSERLAAIAATCLLGFVSHSLIADPQSNILGDACQRCVMAFPPTIDLQSLPFHHTIKAIRRLLNRREHPEALGWKGIDFSTPESLLLAHHLVKIAWLWYQRPRRLGDQKKVPRWVLRFSLHSLLSDPEPPVPIVADCLTIIAIDLGCNVSESDIRNLDKRYAYPTKRMVYCPDCPSATALGISYL